MHALLFYYMKSKIPYYIIALIGTFMLLDFAFVTLAKLTYTGVYTDNHYKKGLDFNKIYGAEIYVGDNSWNSQITLNQTILKDTIKLPLKIHEPQELYFHFTDHQNKPIKNAIVMGKLIRPVTDAYDTEFKFHEIKNGLYNTKISFPMKGQWHIRVKALSDNKEFVTTAKIVIS